MIDEKTLAELEQRKRGMATAFGDIPGCDFNEQAEIIRNARRYLALRSEGVRIGARKLWIVGNDIDAAADRLLEGGV